MTYAAAGGRRRPKSLVISDLRPLFLHLYIHSIIHVNLSPHYHICILICLISICYFLICNSLICYFLIYNSLFRFLLFRLLLFVFYLFAIHYFAFIYFTFIHSQSQKNSPLFRVGSRSVMRTTTEGGNYLFLRENFKILVSLFETVKVDFATDSYSLRC